ncbi:MAG TPA: hypothetical protein VFG52_05220, partial [Xanthomonadales bacterium]|nr:hypothetical protein [Xanthomonadales bacterium]
MSIRVPTALLFLLLSAVVQADGQFIKHQLSFENRKNQYVDVRLTIPVQSPTIDLRMPNWTPGSYLIREYAAQVEGISARGQSGNALPVNKTEKNRWQIDTGNEKQIEVR